MQNPNPNIIIPDLTPSQIVFGVSSIAQMLESTYDALFSSFRAVLGVTDHMGRMREQLGRMLSAIALIRFLRGLARRLFHLFRVVPPKLLGILNPIRFTTAWTLTSPPIF